ncbi:MAG TPA: hypothetical protein VF785_13295 [Gemmatimonadaceae bacterium]
MSEDIFGQDITNQIDVAAGRRRQLRALLLSAADAARRSRVRELTDRVGRPVGRAVQDVRERVWMLLSAAG